MSDRWYVATRTNGQVTRRGPVSFERLRGMAAGGELGRTDLVCREGMDQWLPAEHAAGLFPPAGPALPPLPPAAPAPPEDFAALSAAPRERDRPRRGRSGGSSASALTSPTTLVLAVLGGGGVLLVLMCAGVALMSTGNPVVGPGGGYQLQGTYQRRSNDGTPSSASITFAADGQFEEQGFRHGASIQRQSRTADGQVWQDWGNPQQGGRGTYRFNGTTLALTYTTGETVPVSCAAIDGSAQELLVNTRYTFVRVR